MLKGNLAPRGAVIKHTAASPHLLQHRGPAYVFENYKQMHDEIDSPDLPVTPDTVLVMKNCGPKGAPGFPEWGQIPMPRVLLDQGVNDIVRISDARMSGHQLRNRRPACHPGIGCRRTARHRTDPATKWNSIPRAAT